jgi:hypothetical protein
VFPGAIDVSLLDLLFEHAGEPGQSAIDLTELIVSMVDTTGTMLPPSEWLVSVALYAGPQRLAVTAVTPADDTSIALPLSSAARLMPGAPLQASLRASVSTVAQPGTVYMIMEQAGVHAREVNQQGIATVIAGGTEFPLLSRRLHVLMLPDSPTARFEDHTLATVARGAANVPVGVLELHNPSSETAAPVEWTGLNLRCVGGSGDVVPAEGLVRESRAVFGGDVVAVSSPATPCSLVFEPPIAFGPGETRAAQIEIDLVEHPTASMFGIQLRETDIRLARPTQSSAALTVRPAEGESFPFTTGLVTIADRSFEASVSNYPNPFAAGSEVTRFVFFAPEAGEAHIEIYTGLAERVASLGPVRVSGAGIVEPIVWDGRNAGGKTVVSGGYLAEISLRFDSGGSASAVRRVGVRR